MLTTRINISLPKSFLEEVDRYAIQNHTSRSGFIRLALLEKMNLNSTYDLKPVNKDSDPDEEWKDFMKKLYGK